jgi:hypothetical protein
MTGAMDAAAPRHRKPRAVDLLVGHCRVLDPDPRPAARVRLEAVLGHDFTRRLVLALSGPR